MQTIFVDNSLIRLLCKAEHQGKQSPLTRACFESGLLTKDSDYSITLTWPSLLELLDLGSILDSFPSFEENHPLFSLIRSETQKESLIRAYDQIFVECLTQIKALPVIDSTFLLVEIKKKQKTFKHPLFTQSLSHIEKRLIEHPTDFMHDLILYLAWDRVCVYLAVLFENPSIKNGLQIFQECLLESFQHIAAHGRTTPGFFRLTEALYAYQMREENLDIHTDEAWAILCQSSSALRQREILQDAWYIDAAIAHEKHCSDPSILKIFTLDSVEKVDATLSLVNYMIQTIKKSSIEWHYILRPSEIICLKKLDDE